MTTLTQAQTERIADLRKRYAPRDGYEFKIDAIKPNPIADENAPASVFLLLETGLIDDEGTAAAIFARTRRMFKIGVRGGVKTCNGKGFVPGATWDTL